METDWRVLVEKINGLDENEDGWEDAIWEIEAVIRVIVGDVKGNRNVVNYPTNLNDAMKLPDIGWIEAGYSHEDKKWFISVSDHAVADNDRDLIGEGEAKSMSLAICAAWLDWQTKK